MIAVTVAIRFQNTRYFAFKRIKTFNLSYNFHFTFDGYLSYHYILYLWNYQIGNWDILGKVCHIKPQENVIIPKIK